MADVLVIGGGIGGLSAAVRLLQRGFSVTLVEKEPRPGGYAVSYTRKGYTFDLALHVVPSGGIGQEFHALTKRLGLEVEFIRLQDGFSVQLGDFHFQMANDYDELFSQLARQFPAEEQGLKHFRLDLEKYMRCYAPVFDYRVVKIRSLPAFLPRIPAFLRHSTLPTDQYFRRFFKDRRLMALLFQPAAFMGIGMKDFATVNFMMMFYLLLKNGMYTIKGGGQSLTDTLYRTFLRGGGRILTGKRVTKINVVKKRAVSIRLAEGEELACRWVIAGNNLHDVVNTLIGRQHFSNKYLADLDTLQPSLSVVVLNLGLDCSPRELGIHSHISMFFPDADLDRCFQAQESSGETLGFSITAHGLSDPDSVQESRYSISIVAGTSGRWFALGGDRYSREKERMSKRMLALAEKYHPRLIDHVVVQDLCTPQTMHRYTSNPQGAIMGFNCTAGMHRKIMAAAKLPLPNVVMGSAWTGRLGGFMQSMKSGILAAERI